MGALTNHAMTACSMHLPNGIDADDDHHNTEDDVAQKFWREVRLRLGLRWRHDYDGVRGEVRGWDRRGRCFERAFDGYNCG